MQKKSTQQEKKLWAIFTKARLLWQSDKKSQSILWNGKAYGQQWWEFANSGLRRDKPQTNNKGVT